MANFSIQELLGVLGKSGVPFGDSAAMGQAAPLSRDAVSQQVYGADTQLPALKNNYMSQISAIAQMDQKLAGVYGDPSSKLFIEHPLARERATSPAGSTYSKAAGQTATQYKSRKKDLEDQVDDALSLYNKLVQVQIKEENRLEKEEKAAQKAAKKSGKGSKGTGKGLGGVSGVKLTKDQKLAGFKDGNAANYWSQIKETDFKRDWVKSILEGQAGGGDPIPEDGFTIGNVKENYTSWKKQYDKQKESKKSTKKEKTRKPLF